MTLFLFLKVTGVNHNIKFTVPRAHTLALRLACPMSKPRLMTPHRAQPRVHQSCQVSRLMYCQCVLCSFLLHLVFCDAVWKANISSSFAIMRTDLLSSSLHQSCPPEFPPFVSRRRGIQKSTKNTTFCTEKGVKITIFQSNLKNSWLGFLEFHIWRLFSNRLLIHFFQQTLLCIVAFYMFKRQGSSKLALELAYPCQFESYGHLKYHPSFQLFPAQKFEFLLNRGIKQGQGNC